MVELYNLQFTKLQVYPLYIQRLTRNAIILPKRKKSLLQNKSHRANLSAEPSKEHKQYYRETNAVDKLTANRLFTL